MHRGLLSLAEAIGGSIRDAAEGAGRRSERANLECLRRFYTAVARADYDAAFAQLTDAPHFAIFSGGSIPFQMRASGRGEVQAGIRSNFESLDLEHVQIDTVVAQDDRMVLIGRQQGHWLASGVAFDERVVLELTFRDGRLGRFRGWILPEAP